jgi:transposase-like protein
MGHRIDLAKQAKWLATVRRWQRSNLSVREFCRQQQVNEASFYEWRRVLRERGVLGEEGVAKPATSAFAKLVVEAPTTAADVAIELVLGERRVLRVRAGFDAQALLQLVKLLEDASC